MSSPAAPVFGEIGIIGRVRLSRRVPFNVSLKQPLGKGSFRGSYLKVTLVGRIGSPEPRARPAPTPSSWPRWSPPASRRRCRSPATRPSTVGLPPPVRAGRAGAGLLRHIRSLRSRCPPTVRLDLDDESDWDQHRPNRRKRFEERRLQRAFEIPVDRAGKCRAKFSPDAGLDGFDPFAQKSPAVPCCSAVHPHPGRRCFL